MSAVPGEQEQRRWISSGQGFIGPEPPNDGRRWIEVIEADSAESQLAVLREESEKRRVALSQTLDRENEVRAEATRLRGELGHSHERRIELVEVAQAAENRAYRAEEVLREIAQIGAEHPSGATRHVTLARDYFTEKDRKP